MNPKLLNKDLQVVINEWKIFSEIEPAFGTESKQIIIPISLWDECSDQLLAQNKEVGLAIHNDINVEDLSIPKPGYAFIGIEFPKFMDGRGFSIARYLREDMSLDCDIRALGEILEDQLLYLKRCGFTSFELSERVTVETATTCINSLTEAYQADAIEPRPLFRRKQIA
ncbi:DUF934 domain-containing protein [Gynuella sunshinyii]|uniref:DUF934 domain-containing protein n=1 Tax=Gynuella sunshinyii YC6258 TaxID=1445510 RepID=A0A0C5V725_9GAMM|nr:DUF934 domain-containing protein [Gynuella sunshinyii]AJQ95215.1 hypothetical protein YC6258_03179 [Gynuella sunshinyii YC6258]